MQSDMIRKKLEVYEINDNTIQKIKDTDDSSAVKVINLSKSIYAFVKDRIEKEKYLVTIRERVEQIQEDFERKQIATADALIRLEDIVKEINKSKEQKISMNFDDFTFFVYSLLSEEMKESSMYYDKISRSIDITFKRFPNWQENSEEKRNLKAMIYKQFFSTENVIADVKFDVDEVTNFVEKLFQIIEEK